MQEVIVVFGFLSFFTILMLVLIPWEGEQPAQDTHKQVRTGDSPILNID